MRSAAVQRGNTMIPIGALQQAPEPHVSHAESGAFIKAANPQCGMTKLPLRYGVFCPAIDAGWIAVHLAIKFTQIA